MSSGSNSIQTQVYPDEKNRNGVLLSRAKLSLHSHQACSLIEGRRAGGDNPAITGLRGFARKTQLIWREASKGDPFADWWLIKLDEEIKSRRDYFREQIRAVDEKLNESSEFQGLPAVSPSPHEQDLSFGNTYAFLVARLLIDFDKLVCRIQTATNIGLMDSQERYSLIREAGSQMRSLLAFSNHYRSVDVHRKSSDFDEKLQEGIKHMGEMPNDVLNGSRRPAFDPAKRNVTSEAQDSSIHSA